MGIKGLKECHLLCVFLTLKSQMVALGMKELLLSKLELPCSFKTKHIIRSSYGCG